jgi:hypothetical protein
LTRPQLAGFDPSPEVVDSLCTDRQLYLGHDQNVVDIPSVAVHLLMLRQQMVEGSKRKVGDEAARQRSDGDSTIDSDS